LFCAELAGISEGGSFIELSVTLLDEVMVKFFFEIC
jgi:hypothetical protein